MGDVVEKERQLYLEEESAAKRDLALLLGVAIPVPDIEVTPAFA